VDPAAGSRNEKRSGLAVEMALEANLPILALDQISDIHRLHCIEKWSARKIASHLRIGRLRTIANYLNLQLRR